MESRKNRILFFNLLIFGGVFVLLIGFLEISLRLLGRTSDNFLKQDAMLGWVHMSNKKGWSVTGEYRVPVRLNNFGLVGPDTTLEKPAGTFRIAFVGDSLTEAFQVNPEAAFSKVVERELNIEQKEKKIEVLNFGVTSYGTVKEYYVFENQVLKYKPDLVLLGFFTGNDFSDNLAENINPSASFSFYQKTKNFGKLFLRNHSMAYRFFLEKKSHNKIWRSWQGRSLPICQGDSCGGGSEVSDDALNKTETYLAKFKKLADDQGVGLVVLVLPSKNQINEPADSNLALDSFLSENGFNYLDLLPFFQSWAKINPASSTFFKFDGHPNETGHFLIAKALVDYIRTKVLIFNL
jgi:lysophospholipase L1-like esterase